jgi:hypothetical protein
MLRSIADERLLVIDPANVAVLQLHEAQDLFDVARRLCQQAEQAARALAAHLESLERIRIEIAPTATRTRRPPAIGGADVSHPRRLAGVAAHR